MKYKALLAGIENEEYIRNAEKLVEATIKMSAASAQPLGDVFYAMLQAVALLREK